jgi:hypothetical protein
MMTSGVVRAYVVAISLVVFFLAWALVAARPRATAGGSAAAVLAAREQRLEAESIRVSRLVEQRWARYRAALAARRAAPSPAPPRVRVVTLPPLTTTRSS